MSEMQDRVAQALCGADMHNGNYLDMARAAMEAMRLPTEAMWEGWRSVNCRLGGFGFEEFTCFNGDYGNWVACHQAMIDAALTPRPVEQSNKRNAAD